MLNRGRTFFEKSIFQKSSKEHLLEKAGKARIFVGFTGPLKSNQCDMFI